MNETDILIPRTAKLEIGGRTYTVAKMTMRCFLLLVRYLTKLLAEKKDFIARYAELSVGSKTIMQDIQILTSMLEPEEIANVVAIYVNEPDVKFIEDNLTLEDFSAAVAAFCELTDFEYLKKNFVAIQAAIKTPAKAKATS